ncbi:Topoisomerase IV subunit A [Alkalibacterium sp. AK22]|uniref:general stress protein n=1 Tax=Alkalibacterium sp. AK22 TaxID=1229520 RepID=UPI00044EAFAD|nr:general stress protein [Alkalibacterium sp. AK22]EXJ22631.1 Topoisomerase IV subunit A [Alkalibacterium sp. AK22]
MDWHIIGTFIDEKEAVEVIKNLVEDEGYTPDELALVMDKHNDYEKKINTFKEVRIDKVEVEEESVWEKIRETFSFNSYDSNASHSVLEEYGVSHEQSIHYMDALRDGEIILLAHSDAPSNTELSDLNEEILEEEQEKMEDNKQTHRQENVDPKKVRTSETDKENLSDEIDPSQADDTRKEKEKEAITSSEDKQSSKDEGMSSTENDELKNNEEEDPDLTGQEKTVDAEESEHGYGNTVAQGVVKPEAVSPLNTDEKDEKEPSEETQAPDTDANYPEKSEEAGMTSEK